ncbi:MAG: histidinol dehydrogenase [Planctomycetota bacterium]
MIGIFKAGSPEAEKRLAAVGGRLFNWSALISAAGYRAASQRVFGAVLAPDKAVRRVVADVRAGGDNAVRRYTLAFDGVDIPPARLAVTAEEFKAATKEVPAAFTKAMKTAIKNVRAFHDKVRPPAQVKISPGFSRTNAPVAGAGIYIPGGTRGETPLVSSVYMNVIPAQAAGVPAICVCTPPGPGGRISPFILAALAACGIDKAFRIGGVQAIAAMAYGTATVPAVDFIAGPGNLFVMLAKKEVYGKVGIDLLAGPSEILVIADTTADAALVAADLLSQAEHDPMASSILVTPSARFAAAVDKELEKQVQALPRAGIVRASMDAFGAAIVVRNLDEAVAVADRVAPEHLEIMTAGAERVAAKIRNAGAIFLGPFTPEPIGDYIAGPSHTLPTGGTARFFSGLSTETFMKRTTTVALPKARFAALAGDAMELAAREGLAAHRQALAIRGRR